MKTYKVGAYKIIKIIFYRIDFWIFSIIALGIVIFLISSSSPFGEDIVNARFSYNSDHRLDWWNGVPVVFFGLFPSIGLGWQENLMLFQLLLFVFGAIIFYKTNLQKYNNSRKLLLLIFAYCGIIFVSQMTRDSTLFSFLFFGLSMISYGATLSPSKKAIITIFIGTVFCILAMAFRPWLSLTLVPLFYYHYSEYFVKKNVLQRSFIYFFSFLLLTCGPLVIENSVKHAWHLEKSFPEQQVMMLDLSAIYCWSVENKAQEAAYLGLNIISAKKNFNQEICQSLKPSNWGSLVFYESFSNKNLDRPLKTINPSDEVTYQKFRNSWINVILHHPRDYVQVKFALATQVLLAGENRINSPHLDVRTIFYFPYQVLISLHFFSPLVSFLLYMMLILRRNHRLRFSEILRDKWNNCWFIFYTIWIVFTVVAYIGDNGRYTFVASFLLLFSLFNHTNLLQGSKE